MAEAIYKQEKSSIGWFFWFQWTVATILGGIPIVVVKLGNFSAVAIIGAGIVVGFTTGIMQWLVVRQWVYRAGWWILASAVGGVVAFSVALIGSMIGSLFQFMGFGVVGFIITGIVAGAISGTTIGIIQWFVLRQWVYRAGWWIFCRAVVGPIVVIGKLIFILSGGGVALVLGEIITGTLTGAVTGVLLVWLLKHPRR